MTIAIIMRVTLYIKPRSYDKLFKGKIAEWQERYMDMIYNLLREDVITRNGGYGKCMIEEQEM